MEESIIEITIDPKAADYRRVLYWNGKRTLIIYWIFAVFIFIVCFGGALFLLFSSNPTVRTNGILMPVPIFVMGMLLAQWYYTLSKSSRMLESTSESTKLTFDDAGVSAVAASSSANIIWDKYVKVCETETDFIFFPMEKLFYPVPKRFFTDPESIVALRRLIGAKLGSKAKLLNN